MVSVPAWLPATELGVVLSLLLALAVVRWLDRAADWSATRRSRLLLGVPWGTLTSGLFVLAVYLFVQGGLDHWFAPLTIPYRSWSYLYPLGVVTAAFAHNGVGHLTGNLLGTVVLGSLAEYAWGHYPTERGAETFASWRSNPYVRAFVLFPLGVIVVGLLTSLFSWGPVIGFSGVVFAFAGFALVRYPIGTVVALTVDDVVGLFYRALQDPITVAAAEPSFGRPWWAGIAIQGHLLGLFIGIVLGAAVLGRRERSPSRLFAGTLLAGTSLSLWALWWFRGASEFVLFRGLGVVFVVGLSLLVTLGVLATHRDWTVPELNVPARTVGLLALVLPVLVVSAAAVPLNLSTVADDSAPGGGPAIEVRDYTVVYAEDVVNQQTSVVNLSVLGETTQVRSSGVIVVSGDRHLWAQAVSKARLDFAGRLAVPLGGPGWRQAVFVQREGWDVAGNGTVYRVFLREAGGPQQLAYVSPGRTADPVLAGHRVEVDAGR
ncbi:MAG: rhomboid family intramembrane serine protease [Halobacteriales archaeon]|nr:rhomboid family intramembrane serine protease [Halobacteriales archaeon]